VRDRANCHSSATGFCNRPRRSIPPHPKDETPALAGNKEKETFI
jgi:hypothetical protein